MAKDQISREVCPECLLGYDGECALFRHLEKELKRRLAKGGGSYVQR